MRTHVCVAEGIKEGMNTMCVACVVSMVSACAWVCGFVREHEQVGMRSRMRACIPH